MAAESTDAPVRGILDVIVFSSLAALGVLIASAVSIAAIFSPEGVAVRFPTTGDGAVLTIAGATAPGTYTAADATVLVPGVGGGALAAFAASVIVGALTVLIVLGALIRLAVAFRSGALFTRTTSRTLTLIGGVMFAGSCLVLLTDALGRSGAYAALDLPYEPIHMLDLVPYLPVWVAAISIAMLAGVFERGQRMQRETDLLV
jgi:hypothetical protein